MIGLDNLQRKTAELSELLLYFAVNAQAITAPMELS
jgi:hypothetical protein